MKQAQSTKFQILNKFKSSKSKHQNSSRFSILNFEIVLRQALDGERSRTISDVGCRISNLKCGFTLLEILIATSIVAVLGVVISQVLSTTTRTNTKVGIISDVKQNGDFALATMDRLIRTARRLTSTCNQTGFIASTIALESVDGGTTTLGCVKDGSVTRIASVSGYETSYLTGTNVTLGGTDCLGATLTFTCTGVQGVSGAVSISFRLSQKSTSPLLFEQSVVPFQSTVTVRNR